MKDQMKLLKRMFGPRQVDVWKQLSDELGAEFTKGSFFKTTRVDARIGKWTITLDTFTVSTGKTTVVYTRMRAPFTNDGFRFSIHRKSMFSGVGKLFGMQDIEVGGPKFDSLEPLFGLPSYIDPQIIESGDPEFDSDFIIKSNDEAKARLLFKQLKIRELIRLQPAIELQIKAKSKSKRQVKKDEIDELYFCVTGVIKDLERLKQLFELFSELLKGLEPGRAPAESQDQARIEGA
jgi:hypothetical protein